MAWQAAHLVSGPLDLYRHYEVGVVDWLERRTVNEVREVGRGQEATAKPSPRHSHRTVTWEGRWEGVLPTRWEEQILETLGSPS